MTDFAVPILPSRDLRETLAFYERVGFAYRMREFALVDPSGNLVRVGSPISGR